MVYAPQNRDYSVEEYSTEWLNRFETIKALIKEVFGDKALQIEHVGSTSIVGMKSKPIIDVLIIVEDVTNIREETEKMEKLGYLYKENYLTPNSLFLCKEIDGERLENVHVFPIGHARINEFLDKRDYLREHPDEAKKYSDIKVELSKRFPNDYVSYRKEKDHYLNIELKDKVNDWKNNKNYEN